MSDNNFMNEDNMSEFSESLWNKLMKENKIDRINVLQDELYELIGYPVEINILLDQFVEKYKLDNQNIYFNEEIIGDPITVGDLLEKLEMEDQNRIVCFDPIYLDSGVNTVDDMLFIDNEDRLIIVPKKI